MGLFDGWGAWLGSGNSGFQSSGLWTMPPSQDSGEFTAITQDAGWALQDHSRYGTIALEASKDGTGQSGGVVATITKAVTNLFQSTPSTPHEYTQAEQANECAWYNIPCKTAKVMQATGEFISSTLLKVILLVVVVAIVGIFVMSFAQAKGAAYA